MAEEKLGSPPIIEGLIDIQTLHNPRFNDAVLQQLRDSFIKDYPKVEPLRHYNADLKETSPGTPQAQFSLTRQGYRLTSADKLRILQFRDDGVSVSFLKPYPGWRDLSAEAKKVWEAVENVLPMQIRRVAVRFINQFELPSQDPFSTYLTCPPKVPEQLPQTVVGFTTQIVVPLETGMLALITQAQQPTVKPGLTSIILDIDVFKEFQDPPSTQEAFGLVDLMRTQKNQIFNGSLTKKALDLYR